MPSREVGGDQGTGCVPCLLGRGIRDPLGREVLEYHGVLRQGLRILPDCESRPFFEGSGRDGAFFQVTEGGPKEIADIPCWMGQHPRLEQGGGRLGCLTEGTQILRDLRRLPDVRKILAHPAIHHSLSKGQGFLDILGRSESAHLHDLRESPVDLPGGGIFLGEDETIGSPLDELLNGHLLRGIPRRRLGIGAQPAIELIGHRLLHLHVLGIAMGIGEDVAEDALLLHLGSPAIVEVRRKTTIAGSLQGIAVLVHLAIDRVLGLNDL